MLRLAAAPTDYATMNDDALIEKATAILRQLLDLRDQKPKGEQLIAAAVDTLDDGYIVREPGDSGYEER